MSGKTTKSKIVILRLPPDVLTRFPSDVPSKSQSGSKSSTTSTSTTPLANPTVEPSPAPAPSDPTPPTTAPNGTTTNGNFLAPPAAPPVRRKGIPGPKPGMKRASSQLDINGVPKPRGKPGPKKKIRVGELPNGDTKTALGGVMPTTTTKLNPKANQGAINANLRALDRTGKPTRKWQKKGFQLKSFTGVTWDVGTWRAPRKTGLDANGDVKSDTSGSSDAKNNLGSSAVASEKSNSGGDQSTPNVPIESTSSPAPVTASAA